MDGSVFLGDREKGNRPLSFLSAEGAYSFALQARAFFENITHDDRGSNYIVAMADPARGPGASWRQNAVPAKMLCLYETASDIPVYVTRNGFAGTARKAGDCRQVNAMLFDIDAHEGEHETAVPFAYGAVCKAVSDGVLPEPTMVVDSGRGLQIYYVLSRSIPVGIGNGRAASGIGFFRDVEAGLASVLAEVLSPIRGIEVDNRVYDFSRVSRVPGSMNLSSGTRARLVSNSSRFYNLPELKPYVPESGSAHAANGRKARARSPRAAGFCCPSDEVALLRARLDAVPRLQAHRGYDCDGDRELMCFVYFNTATQLFGPDRAFELTCSFNGKFTHPLDLNEITQIRTSVTSNVVEHGRHAGETGFYPLSAANIVAKLQMTREEMAAISFFGSKRERDRSASKRAAEAARRKRDESICLKFKMGGTIARIASETGVSKRTVSSVLAANNIGRNDRYTLAEKFVEAISMRKAASANAVRSGSGTPSGVSPLQNRSCNSVSYGLGSDDLGRGSSEDPVRRDDPGGIAAPGGRILTESPSSKSSNRSNRRGSSRTIREDLLLRYSGLFAKHVPKDI